MRSSRIGSVLLGLGLLVGATASMAMILGLRPSELPAVLLDIAAYKLALIASLGLLWGGALFLRRAKRAANAGLPADAMLTAGSPRASERPVLLAPAEPLESVEAREYDPIKLPRPPR
jgi:hypothetical protein